MRLTLSEISCGNMPNTFDNSGTFEHILRGNSDETIVTNVRCNEGILSSWYVWITRQLDCFDTATVNLLLLNRAIRIGEDIFRFSSSPAKSTITPSSLSESASGAVAHESILSTLPLRS